MELENQRQDHTRPGSSMITKLKEVLQLTSHCPVRTVYWNALIHQPNAPSFLFRVSYSLFLKTSFLYVLEVYLFKRLNAS